jgi:uncharacterized protein (TIGR02421 family)
MEKLDLHRLKEISLEWSDIESQYRIAPYNAPINQQEEKEKTIEAYQNNRTYNPQFEYDSPPSFPTDKIKAFISNLKEDRSYFETLYYKQARNELLCIESIKNHDPEYITAHSCLAFGLPDRKLLDRAKKGITSHASNEENPSEQQFTSFEVARQMDNVLTSINLSGWKAITVQAMNSRVAINRLDKEIKIKEDKTFSASEFNRLILHEVGVHIFRYENGCQQPIKLFEEGFPGYISTEEGLAMFTEEKFNLLDRETFKKYCGRVVATHLSLYNSFFDVFKQMVPDFGFDGAFDMVTRVKRGFRDTSALGVHSKDIAYLQGYYKLQKYFQENPNQYDILFLGKFGLEDLDFIQSLYEENVLEPPQFLPSQLTNLTIAPK